MGPATTFRLSYVRVFTRDLPRAVRFYGDRVGLEPETIDEARGFAIFPLGGARLLVELVRSGDDDEGLVGRFAGVSLEVDDLARTHAELEARGVRFAHPPRRQRWGGSMTHFHDADDNVLTLIESGA